jgi:hypothetical protein
MSHRAAPNEDELVFQRLNSLDDEDAELEIASLERTLANQSDSDDDELLDRDDDQLSEAEDVGVGFDSTPAEAKLSRCGRALHITGSAATCCCPRAVRTCCLHPTKRVLLISYLSVLTIILVVLGACFWHVWSLYDDTSTCLRDERTMNDFRFVLRTFHELATENQIEYWADFGVLLGGVQRGDVLPWDRDIDISMTSANFERLRNDTTKESFRQRGLYVCPYRQCVRPGFTPHYWPDIDINVWDIDEETKRVVYRRTPAEAADPIRDTVYAK